MKDTEKYLNESASCRESFDWVWWVDNIYLHKKNILIWIWTGSEEALLSQNTFEKLKTQKKEHEEEFVEETCKGLE